MFTRTLVVILAVLVAAVAWGADVAVAHGGATATTTGPPAVARPGTDATMELKWDDGTRTNEWAWYTGADAWQCQEFDISSINMCNYIEYIRFNTYPNWPNNTYEGGRNLRVLWWLAGINDVGPGIPREYRRRLERTGRFLGPGFAIRLYGRVGAIIRLPES